MTVIRPNSISGVSSITAQGGDITYFKSDGTAGNQFTHNIQSTGVITATKFVGSIEATTGTFTGNLGVGGVLTYEDVTNIDSVGVITARSGIRIAAGSTVGPISGIITYFGDGSQLTGIDSTALSFGGSVKIQANASGTIHSGMTTATGGVTIPASTTIGLDLGDGTNKAQLAMQSGVANRIALRTTYSTFGDNNPFIIYQPSSAGVQNDALVVHGSGIVMKPKTPAFHVSRTAGNVGANNYVVFNNVSYNNGSHYNNSDGKFTAPVTGLYFFSAWHFTGGTSAFSLRINSSQFGEYAWDDTGGCATWVCPMNANQFAQIYAQGYTWRGSASYHNGFCGYLIG